jgi:hypothetical protein
MKNYRIHMAVLALVLCGESFVTPRAAAQNPNKIAILKWYGDANRTLSFTVGSNPSCVAFDGANMWVGNTGSANVTKLSASTGAVLGTYPVASNPQGLAFDGTTMWVTNLVGNSLLSSSGSILATYTISGPTDVVFDGLHLWVVRNSVTKLTTGTAVGTYAVGSNPLDAVFDGTSLWVSNCSGNSVTKLAVSNGAVLATDPVGNSPFGLAFDGANIWVRNQGTNSVSKF